MVRKKLRLSSIPATCKLEMDFFRSLEIIAVSCNVIKSRTALSRDTWHVERAGISFRCSFIVTLGSRGYFFLIDTEAALTQNKKRRVEKNNIFFPSALCASLTRLRREPSVSIRKKNLWNPGYFIVRMKSNKDTRYNQTNCRPDYILDRIDSWCRFWKLRCFVIRTWPTCLH